jgi:hypothetical protein
MPLVRITRSGGEGESEGEGLSGVSAPASSVARIQSNLALSDHIGRFIAGEVASQFKNESLADLLKGKSMIMISGSWG